MEKLKPCPFCGGKAEYKTGNRYIRQCHYVRCQGCKMQTMAVDEGTYLIFQGKSNVSFTSDTAKKVVFDIWNRRVQPEPPKESPIDF